MNKFTSLMMGAALLSLSACSSEELVIDTPDIPQEGSALYLAVNIKSGDMSSRAEGDEIGTDAPGEEWDFKYGTPDEHEVARADFYFFDENGFYLAQADVWNGGSENANPSTPSVEYISSNMLVLRGLTKKNPPKYMITVLNDQKDGEVVKGMIPGVTTMTEFRDKVNNWTVTKNDKGNELMLMTTSSYLENGNESLTGLKVGATELDPKNLSVEPIENLENVTPVEVYVERLAAKFTMQGISESTINLTVGGEYNEDGTPADNSGDTKVTITVTGFTVTCTPDKAYYTKHLVTPAAGNGVEPWAISGEYAWNDFDNRRSYWAQTLYYGYDDETGLMHTKFADAKKAGQAVYANENTKPYTTIQLGQDKDNRVNPALVTNVVFTADITIDGKEAQLVNYGGMFYTVANFKQLILNRQSLVADNIKLFKQTAVNTYKQLEPADFDLVRATDEMNAKVKVEYSASYETLYTVNGEDYTALTGDALETAVATLNSQLAALTTGASEAEYYNGKTYYTIPVQHLLGAVENNKTSYVVKRDGEFGIVRNHWYHFTLGTITKLGHGVFDPDEDQLFPDPDPEKETYALAAKVNILSWKIVSQTVDI